MAIHQNSSPEAAGARSWSRKVDLGYRWPSRYLVAWYALAGAVVVIALFQPSTYQPASRELITAIAACLLVAALGQLLVVMVGAIDLAVPGYMTLSAAINVHYVETRGPVFSFLLAVLVCAGLSAISGAMVSVLRLNALIVTLAINTMITGALIIWMGQTFSTGGRAPGWLQSIGRADVGHISLLFLISLVLAAGLSFVVHRTRAGRQVAASGTNPTAARLLGIRVHAVYILAFTGAGVLYAFAGALAAGYVQTPDATLGVTYQITTLTAVAIAGATFGGGPSSVSPLVAACVLLPLIDQSLALHDLSPGLRVVVQGVLLVVAVAAGAMTQLGRAGLKRLMSSASTKSTP
ncbi:ABC transporter permease [Pedococcus sp. 5OH_020]|uniref:ABC transporter permease n=1 Tax=Pedococcus sp. 5OH_020 TaxID=2989814 RepID=UPI0022E9D553|nr:ABC transporter permease [Pedococcus sp. 5OH_020]